MVHIVSILNLTRYETQVNRQWINIILKELTKSNEDIRALFNITNQLATQVQVQNIVLHLRAMLANLRDCLHFMKQLANHVLEYIDTATTGTLTPHLIPVPDLQQMLYQIESELPPNMHLPIPSSDPMHFYRYLRTHVLVEENQFLLLIDVPIQDRAQQIQIYQIINLPVPVGNYLMKYTMDTKYLGVTYDRTKAMDIRRWTTSTLRTKVCTSQMTLQIGSTNHHWTGTYAFTMNTRTAVNILEHHPVQIT